MSSVETAPFPESPMKTGAPRTLTQWRGVIGLALILLVVALAAFAPVIAPFDPNESDLDALMTAPSLTNGHWLGTDDLGRDLLSRVIYGARPVILVAGTSTILAVALGALLGVVAGMAGERADEIVGLIADVQLSIPGLILALVALALFGTQLENLVLILAIEAWPLHYRIARAHAAHVKTLGFVEASWIAGVSAPMIVWRHIIPGLVPLIAASGAISASFIIMTEAGLSFIGLGIQPPTADWGLMIAQGKAQLGAAWWLTLVPAAALVALLLGVQMLGDRLSEKYSVAMDERL